MALFKKAALILAATLAAVYLILWSFNAFGIQNPVFAFLANWLAMSWVAVIGQIVHFSFPPAYYEPKAFERTGRIYEPLGVRVFKMLVRRGPLAIFSPAMHMPKDRTIPAFQQLDRTMRQAETGHVLIFVLALLFSFYALLRGEFGAAGWMLAFNLLINGYPVMLQRYNRIKLQELIGKQGVLSETQVNHVSSGA